MNLEYTVTETTVTLSGTIIEVRYEIEEVQKETVDMEITRKEERLSRLYRASIPRKQYDTIAQRSRNLLTFDDFLNVLRPFIMGYYANHELEEAFAILDNDRSGSIAPGELGAFLPIINPLLTNDTLKSYIRKVNIDSDGSLNYDQFRSLILKGIGRDIICDNT